MDKKVIPNYSAWPKPQLSPTNIGSFKAELLKVPAANLQKTH